MSWRVGLAKIQSRGSQAGWAQRGMCVDGVETTAARGREACGVLAPLVCNLSLRSAREAAWEPEARGRSLGLGGAVESVLSRVVSSWCV